MSNELFVQAERAAMSQRRTSYFGQGYVLDHNFCACLRAVIPSCECCCSPFFCEVVARVHWHKSQVSAFSINVRLKKNSCHLSCHRAVICDSVPVCVAIDRLRPCTSAELLAFHYAQTKSSTPLAADTQKQQGFIDERTSLDILTAADSSRMVEDEQDDEMSEPTRITSAEKRKEIRMDESAKKSCGHRCQ